VLLLGVDRFMSEARAITNTIGNAVATMAIAKWVGAVDKERMHRVLNGEATEEEMRSLYEVDDAPERPAAEIAVIHKASA
jgi:aerobic C4-dicarboxylate transport protein